MIWRQKFDTQNMNYFGASAFLRVGVRRYLKRKGRFHLMKVSTLFAKFLA